MAEALQRLEIREARAVAMEAIGNQTNLFRFVAAETLLGVPLANADSAPSLILAEWWIAHSNCFVICTNEAQVEAAFVTLDQSQKSSLAYAIEMTGELLRKQKP